MARLALAAALAAALLGTLTSTAAATTLPGPNGQLVFTSGRGGAPGDDNGARLYRVPPFGGSALQIPTDSGGRHSHPNWSPDRTRIAYAKSDTAAGPRDIWVYNLLTGADTQITDTNDPIDEDRPAWSPDGTKVAYGRKDSATGQTDIYVYSIGGGINSGTNITSSNTVSEDKPVWSPNGQLIYYARDATAPFQDFAGNDIYRMSAVGANPTAIVATATNEWQPAVSPDGSRICYSHGGQADSGATGVDVYRANATPNSTGTPFKSSTITGEFNCVWSPDGTRIAYVAGVFSGGDLVSATLDGGNLQTLANVAQHFDGNPDWTYNPPPNCASGAATVEFNSFVSIPLTCTDPPDPPETGVDELDAELVAPPENGVLGEIGDNNRVIYTPNVNFRGSDRFHFKSNDGTSDSDAATVNITVSGPGGGDGPGGGPTVQALAVSAKRWKLGSRLPVFSQSPIGTVISVQLSDPGRVALAFSRKASGRRVRGRCVRPTRTNRRRAGCSRYVRAGTLTFTGKRGVNTVRFQGRISRRKRLTLGTYRMSARLTAGGQTSAPKTVSFKIVRR